MDFLAKWQAAQGFLDKGGAAIWVIAALAALTAGLILWKLWRLVLAGTWRGTAAQEAVTLWLGGDKAAARARLAARRGPRAEVVRATMAALDVPGIGDTALREQVAVVAQAEVARARHGLRAFELITTLAPLLGLLGTVLGMIEAFQTLQSAGSRSDPSALAGGIWEALLTTAAGMAVAIPAVIAATWIEALAERLQTDIEALATRLLSAPAAAGSEDRDYLRAAAE